jgi:hypothetical protein
VKESTDIKNAEIKFIEEQATQLKETEIIRATGKLVKVHHTLLPTMVDGKICNAATGTTSTMRCFVYGAISKQFNEFNDEMSLKKTVNPSNLD